MAVSFAQSAFTPSSPGFIAAARGSAALRVEPTQRIIAPAGGFGATGSSQTDEPTPVGGEARAALARVEIVGPNSPSQSNGTETPFSGGRPGALVDQGGIQLSQQAGEGSGPEANADAGQSPDTEEADGESAPAPGEASATGTTLSEEEQQVVEELKARDAEVRRHEQAHAAVGGQYAGSPSYTYQQGPDGGRYAIGGEVSIDASPIEGDPAATIQKLQTVRRAALAPAEPSAADQSVAAAASAGIAQAQAELAAQTRAERQGTDEDGEAPTSEASETAPAETQGETQGATESEDSGLFSIAAAENGLNPVSSESEGPFAGRSETAGISNGIAGALTGAVFNGASGGASAQQPRFISIAV